MDPLGDGGKELIIQNTGKLKVFIACLKMKSRVGIFGLKFLELIYWIK